MEITKCKFSLNFELLTVEKLKISFIPKIVFNDKTLIHIRGSIISGQKLNGETIWEINISEIGKLEIDGQIHNGYASRGILSKKHKVVIIPIFANHIIAIDPLNGQIIWLKKFPGGENYIFPYGERLHIISITREPIYYVSNIKSGEIKSKIELIEPWKYIAAYDKERQRNTQFHWRMTLLYVDKEYLYVTGASAREIGVFDKNTAEPIQIIPLEDSHNRPPINNSPITIDNKLYQLDGDEQLYIFKRS